MKAFTDADKAASYKPKLKTNRNRQWALRESIQIEKKKESKRSKGIISTAFSYKYGFLVLIIGLLIWDITILLERRNFGYDQYGGLVVVLMLLFNHIAYQLTTRGWLSRVMKIIAWTWIILAGRTCCGSLRLNPSDILTSEG